MTKFGQAEYSDFMAKVFADKLDEILETAEKQNFNNKNTEDIYSQFRLQKGCSVGGIGMLVGFLIGLLVGGTGGVITMCLCTATGQADKHENCTGSDE